MAIGFACVRIFRGRPALYVGVLLFNVANLPTMLQPRAIVDLVVRWPAVLPSLILVQIVATWVFVAWGARRLPLAQRSIPFAPPLTGGEPAHR